MKNENFQNFSKTLVALAVGMALTGLALSGLAQAQTPPAPTSPNESGDATKNQNSAPTAAAGSDTVQTVVVSGTRASMARSLDTKRNADIVLDSISATELGRFPDDDVADSLSHINGISISRTTGGDGYYVGVRGLSSQYNIVTLNNRILATDDDGRDLAFDVFPSDLISGADVLKSAQASAIEGSIGGTVNLKTASAFDNPGFHAAARAEENYNDMSLLRGNKFSFALSNTSEDRKYGYTLGLVHSDSKVRTDELNYNTFDPNNPGTWPVNGVQQPVVSPCCIAFGAVFDEKKRDALSGSFEWRPSNEFKLVADVLYSKLNDPQVGYNAAYYIPYTSTSPNWSNVTVANGFITGLTVNQFAPEFANVTTDRQVTTTMFGLNGTWKATSALTLTGDVYQSHAKRPEGGNDTFLSSGIGGSSGAPTGSVNWTATNGGLPNLVTTLPNGMNLATALSTGALSNADFQPGYAGLSGYSVDDKVTGFSLDGVLATDYQYVDHLKFGMAYTDRIKSRQDISNDWTNGSNQYSALYGSTVNFGQLGNNVVSFVNLPNFMNGAGGNFPTTLAVFNAQNYQNALKLLDGQPNGSGGTYSFASTLPQLNQVNSYAVTEKTIAAYGEATLSGESWNGNVGLRLIRTATTASTSVDNILGFTDSTPYLTTSAPNIDYSTPVPISTSGSYIKPLPSANFSDWLRKDLQLRLGVAEVIARPNLNQLAPTQTDGTINRVYEIYRSGNANLKPITAFQQDISLEWYYQPKSALTVAVFAKQIKDFITTGQQYNVDLGTIANVAQPPNYTTYKSYDQLYGVQEPINGDKGSVQGIELGWQHLFDNGFGIHAQYTRNESKAYIQGQYVGQLEGVSPSTASVGVLYEAGPISTNINWDYASSYVAITETEVPGLSAVTDPFAWVTAQFSYDINDNLKLYVEGKNLSNSVNRTYLAGNHYELYGPGGSPQTGPGFASFGRFYKVGLALKF